MNVVKFPELSVVTLNAPVVQSEQLFPELALHKFNVMLCEPALYPLPPKPGNVPVNCVDPDWPGVTAFACCPMTVVGIPETDKVMINAITNKLIFFKPCLLSIGCVSRSRRVRRV